MSLTKEVFFFLQDQGSLPAQIPQIMAPPPSWEGMPTTGKVKVPALLIAFSDYPPSHTQGTIQSRLFGDGEGGVPL